MTDHSSPANADAFRQHDLKTWPEFFAALLEDRKPFELRNNDRDFHVGDELRLHEYDPRTDQFSGRVLVRTVTYILPHRPDAGCAATFGLQPGYIIMGIGISAQRRPPCDHKECPRIAFTSPEHQSAPAYAAAHNSGEGDPSVMPDYVGADTAIQPQCAPHPIETAPKDGTHILAWRIPVGVRVTNNTHPPTVVHWFDDPDEPGFYTSVNERAPEHPFNPTHWERLCDPPYIAGERHDD